MQLPPVARRRLGGHQVAALLGKSPLSWAVVRHSNPTFAATFAVLHHNTAQLRKCLDLLDSPPTLRMLLACAAAVGNLAMVGLLCAAGARPSMYSIMVAETRSYMRVSATLRLWLGE